MENSIPKFLTLFIALMTIANIQAGRCICTAESVVGPKKEHKELPGGGVFYAEKEKAAKFTAEYTTESERKCQAKCMDAKDKLSPFFGQAENVTFKAEFLP